MKYVLRLTLLNVLMMNACNKGAQTISTIAKPQDDEAALKLAIDAFINQNFDHLFDSDWPKSPTERANLLCSVAMEKHNSKYQKTE